MRKLFGFFTRRWIISLLGLSLLALFIWWAGPLFAFADKRPFEAENVRWALIIALFVIYAVRLLWKYLRAKFANANLLRGLGHHEAPPLDPAAKESAEEIAVLKARFEEAVGVLKQAKLGSRFTGQYLYQLPWYVIFGSPGSGKTTALLNSGLKFPLSEKLGKEKGVKVKGVGGTRNCDWWFTEEAVLLDTAGRYTTQDSYHDVDKAAWLGFLDLLKKYRRRRPINGVFVTVSIDDLLHQNETERSQYATAVRQRVQELHERLGIRFPIYVMVTKCDLIAGFQEFFIDFGREERAQIWGVTFPLTDPDAGGKVLSSFATEFTALEQRLQLQVSDRLQRERDPQRRTLIYAFPQQFAQLKDTLESFVTEVFDPSRYNENFMLRGIYFTSGTQEGAPMDRVIGALAATFGLGRQALTPAVGTGKSFFLGKLFSDVIFKEAGLAGTNLRWEKKRAWLQRGAYALVIVLTGLAGLAWLASYKHNKDYVEGVAAHVAKIQKLTPTIATTGGGVMEVLPLLDAISDIPGGYTTRKQGLPILGLGLDQAGKLGSAAQTSYQRLLHQAFFPRIQYQLENQLRRGSVNNPDYLIDALGTYLMLGGAKQYDPKAVQQWIADDWKANLPRDVNDDQRQRLSEHMQALFDSPQRPTVEIDKNLVGQVREILKSVEWHQRVYSRIKQSATEWNMPEFSISTAAGSEAGTVLVRRGNEPLNRGIPALYTYDGYHDFFLKAVDGVVDALAEEGWIMAQDDPVKDEARRTEIKNKVKQLYYTDYIKLWDDLLSGVGLRRFNNFGDGAKILKVISGPESPLKKLLVAIGEQTTLDRPTSEMEGRLEAGKRQAESILKKVIKGAKKAVGADEVSGSGKAKPPERNPVDVHFETLHKLVKSPDGKGPSRLDILLPVLGALSDYLDAADMSTRRREIMPPRDPVDRARREVTGLPQPLGAMMQQLVNNSSNLSSGAEDRRLNEMWLAEVVPFYRQALRGRYPLVRTASDEVTLQDFGKFFGPGGVLDGFFEKNIKPYIDTAAKPWRVRPGATASISISANALEQLQRADEIRKTFFPAGGQLPSLTFNLTPDNLDAEKKLNKIVVDIDGQQLVWEYGPKRAKTFVWPAPSGTGRVRVEVSPPLPSGRSGISYSGPWAVFHMLDEVSIKEELDSGTNQRPTKFHLKFNFEGHSAEFDLHTTSAFNAIQAEARRALERFACPEVL